MSFAFGVHSHSSCDNPLAAHTTRVRHVHDASHISLDRLGAGYDAGVCLVPAYGRLRACTPISPRASALTPAEHGMRTEVPQVPGSGPPAAAQ